MTSTKNKNGSSDGVSPRSRATALESSRLKGNYSLTSNPRSLTPDRLYTYKAFVERVIDGDTIHVQIDLGFDVWHRETIRLRGIDAFEIDEARGKRAKAFVERELKNEPFVILKSTRDDKYGRYLGDIVYGKNRYLNQELLDQKLAVRM